MNLLRLLSTRLFSAALVTAISSASVGARQPPPVITRPVEVWWGSYRNNEDLIGTNAGQWTNVQQQMNGYLLHGAYWNYSNNAIGSPSPTNVGPALATILSNAGNKPVMLEHLLAGEYPDVGSAFGYGYAGETNSTAGFSNAVANIRRLRSYGFNLKDVSTDYIMSTWDRTMRFRPAWTSEEFFTALTGDWDGYSGGIFNTNAGSADRNTYGWFRQWVERLAQTFPDIRVTAVNSPVYFPWYDGTNALRELGENFNSYYTWLKIERRGTNYTTFCSGDGYGWLQLASTNVNLGSTPRAGFFVASLTNRAAEGRVDNAKAFPFFAQDIGDPGSPGRVTNFTTNTIDVVASGNNGLHPGTPSRDAQFYAYREFSGDGTFTARLDSLEGSNPARTNASGELPTAGLTLRESIAVGSRQISFHGNTANQLEFVARGTTGGGLTNVTNPVANQGTTPRWLKFVRSSNTVTALNSTNGTTWTTNGSVTLSNLASKLLVGLVCDSQVTFEMATANFSEIDFGGQPFPGNSFGAYTATTIGNAGTNAASTSSGGVFTLDAAGAGASGAADNLQYHHFAFTNDGTLYARLSYFADNASPATPLNPGAQLGLMLRSDTGANAPQIAVAFTPDHGLLTLARAASNGTVAQINQSGERSVSIQQRGANSFRPLLRYFSGNDYLAGLHGAFPGSYSANFSGFTTDSPYPYQKWGGSEANPDAIDHRRKIVLYEQWLQSRGREHHFIANSDNPGNFDTGTQTGRDSWDLAYKQQSMRSLQLHQLEGGRPDKVIFESWYDGPFTMVPETKDGTFANLVREGIYFVKGMPEPQRLDLLAKAPGATNWAGLGTRQTNPSGSQIVPVVSSAMGEAVVLAVRLTNSAGVPALPVLHAFETGATNGWRTSYTLSSGALTNNVTSAIQGSDGKIVTDQALFGGGELIESGKTADLEITVTPTAASGKKRILLRAFWNPQDPSLAPHDAVSLEIAPPAELIQNGSFENGTSGWTANGGSIALVSGNVYEGTNAIKSTRSQAYQGPAQDILGRLIVGQTYRLSAWVRADSNANIKATVAYIGGTNTNTVFTGITTLSNAGTNWQALQGYFKYAEPNGAASSLKLYFETTGSPTNTGPLYVDSVSLVLAGPEWKTASPGTQNWTNSFNWRSGNTPSSSAVNRVAFLDGIALSNGTVTAQQNLASPFVMNSLLLSGKGPASGIANVQITENALQLAENDGVAPSVELAASNNVSYLVTAPLQLGGDTTVSGDGGGSFEFGGTVSGTNGIVKTGSALLALTASNSFSGGITLAGGTLAFSNQASLGSGTFNYAGGVLRSLNASNPVLANPVLLPTNPQLEGVFTLASALQLDADRTFDVPGGGSVTLAGSISESGGVRKITKTGNGRLILAGSNSFTGFLVVTNSGAVRVSHSQALGPGGSGGVTVNGGANSASLELSGSISIADTVQLVQHNQTNTPHAQVRNIAGSNTIVGNLLLNSGGTRWDLSVDAGHLRMAGSVSNIAGVSSADSWRTLYLSGPGSGEFAGVMQDTSNGLSKLNVTVLSGDWMLSGSNKAYTGATTVSNGMLRVNTLLASVVDVKTGGVLGGSGSTSTNLVLTNGSTVLRQLTNWTTPGQAFAAARVLGAPGTTNWFIRVDGSGLAGFTETSNSITVLSGTLSNIASSQVTVDAVNFPGQGTWSVQTTSSNVSLSYAPLSAYDSWKSSVSWGAASSAENADPDADQLPNFMEYALASNPLQAGGGPSLGVVGNRLTLSFTRTNDPALIYKVTASSGLTDWAENIWRSSGASNVSGPVTVVDSNTIGSVPARFLRLEISK